MSTGKPKMSIESTLSIIGKPMIVDGRMAYRPGRL
jgi:hypothetical protein